MADAAIAAHPTTPAIAAGGTLARKPASVGFRLWLVVELALVYVGAPLVMYEAIHGTRLRDILERFADGGKVGLFLALMPVLAGVILFLLADRTFSLARELSRGFSVLTFLSVIAVFAVAGGAVAAYVHEVHPSWFLEFPRNRPEVYWRIMLLYPVASVVAQELVYRTFYFHRYALLFGSQRWLAILVNGLAFGFAHIVIGNWIAVLSTTLTGWLFATRYATTRSFWAVWLEHTLWGALVFTVGIGRFFFTGVAN